MEDCFLPHPCRVVPAPPHALGGLALSHVPRTLDRLLDSGDTFSDLWMGNVVEPAVQRRRDAVPNPYTVGAAGQIAHGFATILPEVMALGPVGAGVLEGVAETAGRIDEGKPLGTAAALGAIHAAGVGLGAAMPAAAPVLESIPLSPLAQRIASGAAGNLWLGAADRALRGQALEAAGYHEEAAQWRAFDPTYALTDLIMGAGFGGLAHLQAKPSDVDAALTLNAQRNLDNQAPGLPKDALAAQAHQNAMRSALNALDNGEEVAARVEADRFIPDPVREQQPGDDAVAREMFGELDRMAQQEPRDVSRQEENVAPGETVDPYLRARQEAADATGELIYRDVARQLEAAGVRDADQTSAFARLMQQVMVTQAKNASMGPHAFYRQFGPRIMAGAREGGDGQFAQILPDFLPSNMEIGDGARAAAIYRGDDSAQAILFGQAGPKLASDAPRYANFSHSIDRSGINHIKKKHGSSATETPRGQIAITDSDIARIPDIVSSYDGLRTDLLDSYGRPTVAYAKAFDDGVLLYIESVRNKRKDLAALSMRKYPATTDAQRVLERAADGLNVRNDGGHADTIDNAPERFNPLEQSGRGFYDPDSRTVSLFQAADASTFLHESGHYFLDLYGRMLDAGVAPEGVRRDMQALMDWFGVKSFDDWRRMSIDEQRPYHEQFAQGFETYLAEGKAPSEPLRGIFEQFKAWLKQVYNDVQGALGARLSDDVRGVMARIIDAPEVRQDDTSELAAARQLLDARGDETFSFYDDDGNEVSGTLRQLLDEVDQDAADLKNIDAATQAAITCFLRFGDNP